MCDGWARLLSFFQMAHDLFRMLRNGDIANQSKLYQASSNLEMQQTFFVFHTEILLLLAKVMTRDEQPVAPSIERTMFAVILILDIASKTVADNRHDLKPQGVLRPFVGPNYPLAPLGCEIPLIVPNRSYGFGP